MSLNKVFLIGRLTKDPKKMQLPSGSSVVRFTLAVDRNYVGQDGSRPADFINVAAWDKLAEILEKYVSKGRLIAVEGTLRTRNYQDSAGKTVYITEVLAEDIHLFPTSTARPQKEADAESAEPVQNGDVKEADIDNIFSDEDFEPIFDEDIFN
jgi:single-strand DNA-binding protein